MSGKYNWTINQGETSSLTVTRTDSEGAVANWASGATFAMQAKTKYGGDTVLTITDAEVTHSDGTNIFIVTISATKSAAITAPGKYVYDIESTEGAVVTRIIEGSLTVTPEVTI